MQVDEDLDAYVVRRIRAPQDRGAPSCTLTRAEWAQAHGYNEETRRYDLQPRPETVQSLYISSMGSDSV